MPKGKYLKTAEHKQKIKEAIIKFKKLNPPVGKKNPNWKGGVRFHHSGYVLIYVPNHPFARTDGKSKKYITEHRLIIEDYLREKEPSSPYLIEIEGKKYLSPKVVVHHIDCNRSNNNFNNLAIMPSQSEHIARHNQERTTGRGKIVVAKDLNQ